MKKVMTLIFSICLLSLISAESLSDLVNKIEPATFFLIVVFLISFALIYLALSRVFKQEEKRIAIVIALLVSAIIAYGINRINFFSDFVYNFSYNFSFSGSLFEGNLYTYILITLIILIIASVFSARRKKKKDVNLDWEEWTIGQILAYILAETGIIILNNNPSYGEITMYNLVAIILMIVAVVIIAFYSPLKKH